MPREITWPSGVRYYLPNQQETAVTRVTDYLQARQRYNDRGDLVALELRHVGADKAPQRLALTATDLQGLLDIIADLCDDHTACEHCQTRMCDSCGIGEPAGCVEDHVHCIDCVQHCGPCGEEYARERREELRADAAWEECAR